ncbi:hypothetical protein HAZT_HAZT009367, partial [Hyalella azteca]
MEKGWRCLDCTVCEGCGERNDEARLVLCEDCDISCHIYCMTPPLPHVPQGVWKCKWCAFCHYCGSKDPGSKSAWKQNYSMCGPCHSLTTCPVCASTFRDGDLIVQCDDCSRWMHGLHDYIHTEDDAEKCAERGYSCQDCRPPDSQPSHLVPTSPSPSLVSSTTTSPAHMAPNITTTTSMSSSIIASSGTHGTPATSVGSFMM